MSMMAAEELRTLARQVREEKLHVDATLVDQIARDVELCRSLLAATPTQLPPKPIEVWLRPMGWLIYEASLQPLWDIPPDATTWSVDTDDSITLVRRLVELARALPWPEFAPRALGSLRVAALIESKRDTEAGYDAAWALHEEARVKYELYRESHQADADRERYVRDLDEVLLQLALAETGTACRAAERVIGLWIEGVADGVWTERDSRRWTDRMFRELTRGAEVGEYALRIATRIDTLYGFAKAVDEDRLALPTSYHNPAVMTCRALLLLYSMSHEMDRAGRRPAAGAWDEQRADLLDRFFRAFGHLHHEQRDEQGQAIPLRFDHLRSMVQLCLHLALLTPGRSLGADLKVDVGLTIRDLDDAAVEALSAWLATPKDGSGEPRGDANTIGSASMPSFIASVEACRRDPGAAADYRAWRRRWPQLDRYRGRADRRERLESIFDATPGDDVAR